MISPLAVSVEGAVATLRMQDPKRRNALGTAMLQAMTAAFDDLAGKDIRAVVLRAQPGAKVWSAGFDIRNLAPGVDPLAPDAALPALFRRVRDFPAPVIAMLHGTAWGGGTDLALRCDIAIADPDCTLAFTPARLGLPYDPDGLRNVLLRGGVSLAIEMFATADPIPAERALAARAAQPCRAGSGARGVHLRDGGAHRRQRAALRCRGEASAPRARRCAALAAAARDRCGARGGFAKRGLRRRTDCVRGAALPRFQGTLTTAKQKPRRPIPGDAAPVLQARFRRYSSMPTVTDTGADGMPLATTCNVLGPVSAFVGTMNEVETIAEPVATPAVLQL